MRVTRTMLVNTVLQNLNRNNNLITRYQNEIASGKRINTASDDPVGASRALRLRNVLSQNLNYIDNSGEGAAWLVQMDTALGEIGDVLNEARELAIYGAGGTLPADSMLALAEKADQLINHLIQVGNSTYGDRYIFAGQNTSQRPIIADPAVGAVYAGDNGVIPLEISWGASLPINTSGQAVFFDSNVFNALVQLRDHLRGSDAAALSGPVLNEISSAVSKILTIRAEVGSKAKRIDLNLNRLEDNNISLTKLLSQTEDSDIPFLTMHLSLKQYSYEATLMVGAKIMQPSLVDFLR